MMIPCKTCESTGWLVLRTCRRCHDRPNQRPNCRRCYGAGVERVYVLECPACRGVGKKEAREHVS